MSFTKQLLLKWDPACSTEQLVDLVGKGISLVHNPCMIIRNEKYQFIS